MSLVFPTEETIAAIASAIAPGQGAIAIIKVSGANAKSVVKNIVRIPGKHIWSSHKVLYGYAIDKSTEKTIDEVLILIMDGPRSFTGEDVIEIHCHGGLIAVQQVLEQVLNQPNTRRAFPGEFSQRAVLNGRLDITQAESINDLISAKSQKAAQLAIAGINGDITEQINSIRKHLIDQLTEIEARIDFEEDLPKLDEKALLTNLFVIRSDLQTLVDNAKQGSLIRDGVKVALIGRPNVGKSSLLNLLCKKQRAIVTDLPGTTRDLLHSEIILEGIPMTIIDTAGIRDAKDKIEQIGISLSHQTLITADVVVMIFDVNKGWTDDDQNLLADIPTKTPKLIIGNKGDLEQKPTNIKPDAIISALHGQGEKQMIHALLKLCGANNVGDLEIALNQRQLDLVKQAIIALDKLEEVSKQELPWDFWTIDLRDAIYKLGELTGDEINEALLERIFARFCIGK